VKSSTNLKPVSLPDESSDSTSEGLIPVLIVRLHCGCTMSESVNKQRTRTSLQLWRASTCRKSCHFTGHESGWPQIEDAVKATILHSDVLFEKHDEHDAT